MYEKKPNVTGRKSTFFCETIVLCHLRLIQVVGCYTRLVLYELQ